MSFVINTPPHAAALMQSLRDIGYELDTALADLIDNSISANANTIDINFQTSPHLRVTIIDNGDGMDQGELLKAMVIGSKNPLVKRDPKDLGRFGLGLKTASFSQCKKLTVISKKDNIASGAQWDLDYVSETNKWSLYQLGVSELEQIPEYSMLSDSGTMVIWEKCDRLYDPDEEGKEDYLYQKFEEAENHIRVVFHRFLDSSYRSANNMTIRINNREIDYIDPFFRNNLATQKAQEETIRFHGSKIRVQGYTLPHHSKCLPDDYEKHALHSGYRDSQGFYVYRENRLLISGTWFRLVKKSDLTALTRVEVNLPNNFDSEWHIDIKKSHATPPKEIREQFKQYIEKYVSGSKRVYTSKGYRVKNTANPVWIKTIDKNVTSYQVNTNYPFFKFFKDTLNTDQVKQFEEILKLVEQSLPLDQLYVDYASSPKSFKTEYTSTELEELALQRLDSLDKEQLDKESVAIIFESSEPFNKYKKNWNDFLENNWS